jgi:hypothetical protein
VNVSHCSGNIRFPTTDASLQCLASEFAKVTGAIPNVVAAVDGIVFETDTPRTTSDSAMGGSYCRKGYFAVGVLAFVDAHMRILSLSMSVQSSAHDSTLFAASDVGRLLDTDGSIAPHWVVVGDDAFKSHGHIVSPFTGHTLTPPQRAFNYHVSLCRCIVERAFALWKGKWGIFWRPLKVDETNIKLVIEVTARLHNFCIDNKCSTNCDDYVVYDDYFWARTSSNKANPNRRRAQPPPYTSVTFADADTIAAFLGAMPRERSKRLMRLKIMEYMQAQGYGAPVVLAPSAKERRSALDSSLRCSETGALLVHSVHDYAA